MLEKPRVVQTAEQLAAVMRFTIPRSEIRNVVGPGLPELIVTMAAQGITLAGPWFMHQLRASRGNREGV